MAPMEESVSSNSGRDVRKAFIDAKKQAKAISGRDVVHAVRCHGSQVLSLGRQAEDWIRELGEDISPPAERERAIAELAEVTKPETVKYCTALLRFKDCIMKACASEECLSVAISDLLDDGRSAVKLRKMLDGCPRCCRTHALEHDSLTMRMRNCNVLVTSNDSPQKPLSNAMASFTDLETLHMASRGDNWLVIVGGEHGGVMRADPKGTRPGPFLAGHTSLQWVGVVFARLLPFFGRDRIVVIAQVQETLAWMRNAAASEEAAERLAGRASFLPMLRNRLAEMERDCATLLKEGGADYDGADVNPSTVLNVLRGKSCDEQRVVPQTGVGSVTLLLASHGHSHPAFEGSKNHEWYMHLPHPTPDEHEELYDVVSHRGFENVDPHPKWDWGAPKHRWKLYSQMLFQAYHEILERTPWRRHLLFHQFCLSGGASEFMRSQRYRSYFATRTWPVFAITTAGLFEPSICTFIDFWTEEFARALAGDESYNNTLGDVYKEAARRYWEAHSDVTETTKSKAYSDEMPPEESEAYSVGTIGHEAGLDCRSLNLMSEVPVKEFANCLRWIGT